MENLIAAETFGKCSGAAFMIYYSKCSYFPARYLPEPCKGDQPWDIFICCFAPFF